MKIVSINCVGMDLLCISFLVVLRLDLPLELKKPEYLDRARLRYT